MDVLSVALSVTALLAVASRVVKGSYTIMQLPKEFEKDVRCLTDELALLVGVLHSLLPPATEGLPMISEDDSIETSESSGSSNKNSSDSDSDFETIHPCKTERQLLSQLKIEIRSCRRTLDEIESLLSQFCPKPGERIVNAAKQMQWSLKKSSIQRLRQSLEKHKTTFILLLSVQGKDLLQDQIEAARLERDSFRMQSEITRRRQSLERLSAHDFGIRHRDLLDEHVQGTGQWFLNDSKFLEWVDEPHSQVLWCQGKAGSGKTMLTTTVIEYLQQKFDGNCATAYVYFDYQEHTTQNTVNVLYALLKQLLDVLSPQDWPTEVVERLCGARVNNMNIEIITRLILLCARRFPKVYLLFDAVDECETPNSRWKLLQFINKVLQGEPTIRVYITSRPRVSLVSDLTRAVVLSVEAQSTDIEIYIRAKIHHQHYAPSLENDIIAKLVSQADGMFLLPAVQLAHILRQFTPSVIRKSLSRIPSDLNVLYDEALMRIQRRGEEAQSLAYKVFAWLLFATRPLTVIELVEALSVEEWETQQNPENRIHIDFILECCTGLITIQYGSDTVHFNHETVKSYLSEHSESIPTPVYLARVCITYLLFETSESTSGTGEEIYSFPESQSPFQRYAAENWIVHLKGKGEHDMETMERVKELLTVQWKFDRMIQPIALQIDSSFRLPLHIVALAGLSEVTNLLLKESWNIPYSLDQTDLNGRTVLHAASIGGDPDTIVKLIKWKPELVQIPDKDGRTPLHEAVQRGHLAAINILLSNNADAKAKDNDGRDPLYVAMAWREEKAAQLIFNNVFNNTDTVPQAGECFGWYSETCTLLHQAAHLGCSGAIESMLEAGADPHATTSSGLTPLYFAARKGHNESVKILLRAMKNIINPTFLLDTPLHRAAKWGREETVKTLVAANPEAANFKDPFGFTPLHWAAAGGYLEVVKILLPTTEFTILQKGSVPSPFCLASWGQHKDVFNALAQFHRSTEVYGNVDRRVQDIVVQLDGLTKDVSPELLERAPELCRSTEVYHHYGLMQMRKGRLRCASAWFDLALMLSPLNENIDDPQRITNYRKYCDFCLARPIQGPCFTCTMCWGPCYDLCSACFEKRSEIGHSHDQFLMIPSSQVPIQSIQAQVEILREAMIAEEDI